MIPKPSWKEAAEAYISRMLLSSDPLAPLWNRESILCRKSPKWNYIDACMMNAAAMLCDLTGDESIGKYIGRFTDAYVTESGDIPTFRPEDFNLDSINGGKTLLWLYKRTGREKYLAAAEKLFSGQLSRQPRTPSGSFWHKAVYPGQVWLDGTYMAFPFMAEYALMKGDGAVTADISAQLRTIRSRMRDSASGLYYHGLDELRREKWADPVTGLSGEFWLRSMGWLSAALADICGLIPDDEEYRSMLSDLLEALADRMTEEGMLLQLPLRKELPGNYPETSGTLLFAYSAMKAARLGIADDRIRQAGTRAFGAVADGYISVNAEGLPVLRNICLMAGLGGTPYRDGSAEYYLGELVTENDAKGIAPFLMAYAELCAYAE
ncbi:MAG: glycoside hydrolase family 88 protein [Ruminococcus sp.]|nr:glycoside hydrolase family 88 protein [Ruminococcus sp.]